MKKKFYCNAYQKDVTCRECEELLKGEREEDLANDPLPYIVSEVDESTEIAECRKCKRYQAYREGESIKGIGEPTAVKLSRAIEFATRKHAKQRRKGSDIPYIMHPLETMGILQTMDADCSLLMAGVLHDVVEDTDTTIEMIIETFGEEVAELVGVHSEEQPKSWDERKEKAIDDTAKGSTRFRMLVLADKVSNLRSLYKDYQKLGEKVWERFNASKEKQAQYYSRMIDALEYMQYDSKTSKVYWEMVGLFKDIFVKFYYSSFWDEIYQICVDGENYCLDSSAPKWNELTYGLPDDVVEIDRRKAEWLEDRWAERFYNQVANDLQDGEYELYSSPNRQLTITLRDRKMTLCGYDIGKECNLINGKDSYEFVYELQEESAYKLFTLLRMRYVQWCTTDEILKREFGYDDGSRRLEEYCKAENIEYCFLSF